MLKWFRRDTSKEVFGHSQFAVARFLLGESLERGYTVTHMKLQKLVFLGHAWMLAFYGSPLVRGRVEAWEYGPVFPQLYHEIKHKGAARLSLSDLPEETEEFDEDETALMMWIVERYGPLTAARLSSLTHAKSSPWEFTRRMGSSQEILPEQIQVYYRILMESMNFHRPPQPRNRPA